MKILHYRVKELLLESCEWNKLRYEVVAYWYDIPTMWEKTKMVKEYFMLLLRRHGLKLLNLVLQNPKIRESLSEKGSVGCPSFY